MKPSVVLISIVFFALSLQCGQKKDGSGQVPGNTPPVVSNITLLPSNPTMQSEISARILSIDKDGDPVTYKVLWFVNDQAIGEGMSFAYEDARKGDKIHAEVTPYDGKAWGEPVLSGPIFIGNLPPRVISVGITPDQVFVTTPQVTISAVVEDPDRDTIQTRVHWLINDEVLQDTSTVLTLRNIEIRKNDVITGAAFAFDGEEKSEPFPFEIKISNSAPVIGMQSDSVTCRPDSVYYKLPIFDPDDEPLRFELVEAPSGIMVDPEQGIVYGSSGSSDAFVVLVRATDEDGAYLDAQFTLTPR